VLHHIIAGDGVHPRLPCWRQQSRGWPAFAGHDTKGTAWVNRFVTWYEILANAIEVGMLRDAPPDERLFEIDVAGVVRD
jgi:hypothetical protein